MLSPHPPSHTHTHTLTQHTTHTHTTHLPTHTHTHTHANTPTLPHTLTHSHTCTHTHIHTHTECLPNSRSFVDPSPLPRCLASHCTQTGTQPRAGLQDGDVLRDSHDPPRLSHHAAQARVQPNPAELCWDHIHEYT